MMPSQFEECYGVPEPYVLPPMQSSYYRGCCLDDGSYIDYALLSGSPSRSSWMIPGTWKED